ncbi:formyltetrahydrofolate-dependent phosphoribosylglycinamide formyltransferase [Filimonas lacunae]|uniref:Phosphoribosylglycinamide formyltransferase n=1 Tax=Filimonas lacunae TaxID=477680 RepID=A0A173MQQ8_9BACT|nr:phosphoribosylglycinamide formyltransferase [Filimonas lacunae]BAV09779.1 phosphoribosylglycinamide formyltransferase [Filimonas lacunae]SIS78842.1 formyltetrahydrofolate-dependent phosphoribosylglycinamide formyltransferase [Filimonas lacunae]
MTTDKNNATIKIAVFASGAGSNARKLIEHFNSTISSPLSKGIEVALVVSNKIDAGVLQIAAEFQIPTLIIEKEKFFRGNGYVDELKQSGIDFVVLAGFLWKIPSTLVQAYAGAMVNIHPALLPKYGGKGMYGNFVHEAVIANKEPESGITIHMVDEVFDNGAHLFQATCPVLADDTPATLAQRIHQLEHAHYPRVVEETIRKTGKA